MDAQERIIKTINHEEPDRVPSYDGSIDNLAICDHYGCKYPFQGAGGLLKVGYYAAFGSKKLLSVIVRRLAKRKASIRYALRPLVKLQHKIGIDLLLTPLCLFPRYYNRKGYIDEFGRVFEFKKNPSDNMDVGYYMGGAIKDFEDYEKFPRLDPDWKMRENAYRVAKEFEEKYNNEVYIAPAIMGMMESTWEGMGLENFSKLLARPKEAKKIFDDRGEFAVEMIKRVIEWGETGAIWFFDDYGYKKGLFMSPRSYNKYVIPWVERMAKTAHKGGLKLLLHSCGDILPILEDLIKAGIDGLNPIEPTTANPDYDIFKLNEKYGDKLCWIGNVSPQDLSDKDPDTIRAYTKRLIKELAPGGGFILASGHTINPAIKLENYLAMRETLEKYCSYPIKVD